MMMTRVPAHDVAGHQGADAVREHRGLVGRGGRLALHDWLGLHDFEGHAGRQFEAMARPLWVESITAMPS